MLTWMLAVAAMQGAGLVNGGFDNGLTGWVVEGAARGEAKTLKIGPGKGAVRQRYDVPGLRVLFYGAKLKGEGEIRLRCFDRKGRLLMDRGAGADPKKGEAGIYLKTQADTAYVELSIEKTREGGTVVADDVFLKDDDRGRVEHRPRVNLETAMRPIWQGREIADEAVLLFANGAGPAKGRLLFAPKRVRMVRDATFAMTFREGKDYRIVGDQIVAVPGSPIPTMREEELAKGEFPWTTREGRHIFVTYEHDGIWTRPLPEGQGDRLPITNRKLREGSPLTVVAYGDSITQGVNVSGFRNAPPYLPPWPSLFARELGRRSGNRKIRLINAALGGMRIDWARDNAEDTVAALNPDLVTIGFGMNDFWAYSPAEFQRYVEETMAIVRARRPRCEFVLIASMRFDPAYTQDPTYVGNLLGYASELRKMAGPGVAVFDMTALSDALYRAKSAEDLTTDPMHPNDFLSRWYAQGIVATVVGK